MTSVGGCEIHRGETATKLCTHKTDYLSGLGVVESKW